MKAYIGVDVSKDSLDVAILLDRKIIGRGKFGNEEKGILELIDFARMHGAGSELFFACEATGVYHWDFANTVYKIGEQVSVINPRKTKNEAESMGVITSTDRKDAEVIANYASRGKCRLWVPAAESEEYLRELIVRREQIIKALNAEKSHLERFKRDNFTRKSVKNTIERLEKELKEFDKEINKTAHENEELSAKVELGKTVPGVGPMIMVSFIGKVGDVNRFANAEQLLSYLGVCPQSKTSGKSVNRSWMSRRGDALFRKHLYMGAMAASRSHFLFKNYYDLLVSKGRCHQSALAAVMRKILRVLFAVLRDSVPFSTKKYGINPNSEILA
jgi:transposase